MERETKAKIDEAILRLTEKLETANAEEADLIIKKINALSGSYEKYAKVAIDGKNAMTAEKKVEVEHKHVRNEFIGTVINGVLGVGNIVNTDVMAMNAFKFEEDGSICSLTGKSLVSKTLR